MAHAAEFCILAALLLLFQKGEALRTFYTGFTFAFLDESLQLFTTRSALVSDIWIDLCGVLIGIMTGKAIRKTSCFLQRKENRGQKR